MTSKLLAQFATMTRSNSIILASYRDATRPLFVPQEARNINGDFHLLYHVPNEAPNFPPNEETHSICIC